MASTHFHLARVYAELGTKGGCDSHVEQALALHAAAGSRRSGQRKSELSEEDLAMQNVLWNSCRKAMDNVPAT
jgi:hypothetical protein